MSSITHKEVVAVAALARLSLTPEEQERFRGHLADILQYVEHLNALDTTEVPPTNHVADATDVVRADAADPAPVATVDALRANVPEKDGNGVKVHVVLKDA